MNNRPVFEEDLITSRDFAIGFLIFLCPLVVPWVLMQIFPFQPTRSFGAQALDRHFGLNDLRAAGFVACVLGAALLVLAVGKLQERRPSGSAFAFALALTAGGVIVIMAANALIPPPPTSFVY